MKISLSLRKTTTNQDLRLKKKFGSTNFLVKQRKKQLIYRLDTYIMLLNSKAN